MPYFLAITGSPTKFSRSGFLLRNIASLLKERSVDFEAIHALDLPPDDLVTGRIAEQFIGEVVEQIKRATAIVIITPANSESSPGLLLSVLDRLPGQILLGKPVLLFATGGFQGHVAFLERTLSETFYRLGASAFAARVHIGAGSWINIGDDRPRLTQSAEREIAIAVDLVLQVKGQRKHFSYASR